MPEQWIHICAKGCDNSCDCLVENTSECYGCTNCEESFKENTNEIFY